ncbi:MAG: AAA family ATPase [Candidatus Firestonebacteria bacterium]|nr:AAA family ATPase [Candidatus Firestonebacteria bacterium]
MSFTIAVAGKGGTGKTTICGLLIRYLIEHYKTPILAIDADPNMNLNEVLGLKVQHTIGSIREKSREENNNLTPTMSKIEYLDLMINQALIEGSMVDLLVMGQPEGPGCYCAANHLIRRAIDQLSKNYQFIAIDNEAGMEHLSRHTTQNVDILFIISDFSVRGLQAAIRIKKLIKELDLNIEKHAFIVNRVNGELPVEYKNEITKQNLYFLGELPEDELVTKYDKEGTPLSKLTPDSIMLKKLFSLLDSLPFTQKMH